MTLVFIWLLATFFIASFSILIGKRYGVIYPTVVFASLAMLANILAAKIVLIGEWAVPAGTLVFITTYLVTDLVSEIWGKKEAQNAVWAGFYVNVMAAISIWIAVAWPAAPFNLEFADAYTEVLSGSWRIFLASMLGYLVSMHLDVIFFHRIKDWTEGRHFWLRNNFATIPANFLGAIIFAYVAFYGIVPDIWTLVITLALIQSVMILIDTPVAYLIRHFATYIPTKH